jgi:tetratricopeptide (TPR) repeat protein
VNRAEAQSLSGKAGKVVTICQGLLEQTDRPYIRIFLSDVLGTAHYYSGDLDQAVEVFEAALSLDMIDTNVMDKLAETYRELGRYEKAIELWQECLVDPGSAAYFYVQIVRAYRQMGDLVGEEAALRDWIVVDKRGGCLLFGWGARPTLAALGQLAGCLRRQGREAEARSLSTRIRRRRPRIRADSMADWAYWVREWMLAGKQDVPLDYLARFEGQEAGRLRWSLVLRAVLYDQMERPRDAAPFWHRVEREIVGKPNDWVLDEVRDMMGDLVPASSRLFELVKKT